MKRFLVILSLALVTYFLVACKADQTSPTEPLGSFGALSRPDADGTEPRDTVIRVPRRDRGNRDTTLYTLNLASSNAIASTTGWFLYAFGASLRSGIIFLVPISFDGTQLGPAKEKYMQNLCLLYNTPGPGNPAVFMGNCTPTAFCRSTGGIGQYGPVFTGTCDVPGLGAEN